MDGTPTSGEIVRVKAEKLHKAINGSHKETADSRGWLQRWQKRHGITQVKISGELKSADLEAAASFSPQLKTYMNENQLIPEQIYNCDETTLLISKTASFFYCAAIQLGHTSCGL